MQKALNPNFDQDVFTFARLHFDVSDIGAALAVAQLGVRQPGGRLEHHLPALPVTSLKIRPGLNAWTSPPKISKNFPSFTWPPAGGAVFSDKEVTIPPLPAERWFMMVDDFWGDDQWEHFSSKSKRVFPDREPVELSIVDPIFHIV